MKDLLFKLDYEVRQSLHHMMGMLEFVAEGPLSADQSGYLSQCKVVSDGLFQIANDVTELASAERPHSPCSTFSVTSIVEEVAGIMTPLARRKGLEFVLSINPPIPTHVFSERDTIQDMLRRLLDNSIKVTERGRVTLSATSAPIGTPDSALLVFDVSDTGPGMRKEILEEFRELPESFEAGLDFSVVRRRLVDMNGELTIQSNTPDGTALRMSLPVKLAVSTQPAAAERNPHVPPSAARHLKLLVVEDSNISFQVFQVYVREEGHAVSRALNGAEALDMVKANEYDIVVMDVDMPVMDGYTATRMIREWETRQGTTRIPIIMLSAESALAQRSMGAGAGCSGYLTKPVPKKEVLKALNYFAS